MFVPRRTHARRTGFLAVPRYDHSAIRPPRSARIARPIPTPDFRGNATDELEHLDHVSGRERLHDSAGDWFDFRGRLAHFHARDSRNLLPERVGGIGKQLPVKLLDLGGTGWSLRESLLGR